mmetsp:Transcript_8862/g.20012  ORF Transcript_8862/g.20012 Transcript_8862/m.20012 type:complete len:204 (+) Transcript_8862:148-759(+)
MVHVLQSGKSKGGKQAGTQPTLPGRRPGEDRDPALEVGRRQVCVPDQIGPLGPVGRGRPRARGDPGRARLLVRRHHHGTSGSPPRVRRQSQGLLRGAHPRRRGDPVHPGRQRLLRRAGRGGQVDPDSHQGRGPHNPARGDLPPLHVRQNRLHPRHAALQGAARVDPVQPPTGGTPFPKKVCRILCGACQMIENELTRRARCRS